jgi:hypothetical protein
MSIIGCFMYATDEEIRSLLAEPEQVPTFVREREKLGQGLEVDKEWHALHWLLTGSEEEGEPPLNFILVGGTEIGHVDVGYGPARAFTSDQVQIINEALAPITSDDLLARYNGYAMSGLYPNVWARLEEEEQNRAGLAYHFDRLKRYINQAQAEGLGILVYAT